MTMPGRFGGPERVIQTCPEIVAPLRAVHRTGRRSPATRSQSYIRTSPAQPSWWFEHRFAPKSRSGSVRRISSFSACRWTPASRSRRWNSGSAASRLARSSIFE